VTGALNFRDLGGAATSDGHVVRRGVIFRSGELSHLTAADFKTLDALHVGYIFDLRTDGERATAPTVWSGVGPEIIPVSVGFDAKADPSAAMSPFMAKGATPDNAMAAMRAITAKLAIDGAPAIAQVLLAIGVGHEPAIIHCTAGKDRTGIVSAFLLTLLGVPKEAVYENYLRSNDAVPAEMAKLKASAGSASGVSSAVSAMPLDTVRVLMGVDRSYLDSAYAAIDSKYGSFDMYVRDGLKMTPADVQALRKLLLEPAR
jgi:protein-tyrosine phosphatase